MKVKKSYLIAGISVLGMAFLYFMATSVVPKAMVTLTKAAPASKVSLENSYFIGGDILAKADGVDKCVLNVFVLDKSGKGIKGKSVVVSGMGDEFSAVSGSDGLAKIEVSSASEGQFELEASVEGVPLTKTVKVTFRN